MPAPESTAEDLRDAFKVVEVQRDLFSLVQRYIDKLWERRNFLGIPLCDTKDPVYRELFNNRAKAYNCMIEAMPDELRPLFSSWREARDKEEEYIDKKIYTIGLELGIIWGIDIVAELMEKEQATAKEEN